MSDDPRDPWRLHSVDRFGQQLRELERSEHRAPRPSRSPRFAAIASVATVAMALIVVALLDLSRPAHALSPVNRAPALVVASKSVTFRSTTSVLLGGRSFGRFSQEGVLDFAAGEYSTLLDVQSAGVSFERRRVGGVIYVRESHAQDGALSSTPWLAARLAGPANAGLVSAPQSAGITDPIGLFRILEKARAPVRSLGPGSVDAVPVLRYSFRSDLGSIVQSASGSRAPQSYRGVSAVLNVALDGHGRPLAISETFSGSTSRGACVLSTTVRFSGFGSAVHISAPRGVSPHSARPTVTRASLVADPARLFEHLVFVAR